MTMVPGLTDDESNILWHHCFGVAMQAYFADSGWEVHCEYELSKHKQFLDFLIVSGKDVSSSFEWPDGFDNRTNHNLISFRSIRQALTSFILLELCGHFVNYCKQGGLENKGPLPDDQVRMYACCMRFPRDLAAEVAFHRRGEGVYDVLCAAHTVRVIVLSQVPESQRNALLNLFSNSEQRVEHAMHALQPRMRNASGILATMLRYYRLEGLMMSPTIERWLREMEDNLIRNIPVEQILQVVPAEQLCSKLSPQDRLKGISPEDRLDGLDPETRLKGLDPETRLKGMSEEQIREYLNKLQSERGNDPSSAG